MDFTNDPIELVRSFNRFIYSDACPEIARDRLQTIPGSNADVITQGAEILYAHRELLDEAGLTVLGQLYNYAHDQGWSTFCADDRCRKIVTLVRVDLNEIKQRGARNDANEPEPNTALRADKIDWRAPKAGPTGTPPPDPEPG